MSKPRLVVLIAFVAIGSAAPALATDTVNVDYSFPVARAPMPFDTVPSVLGTDISDFRKLVLKKITQDGGTLTDTHRTMLEHRWRRIIAEQADREHRGAPGNAG